MQELTVFRSSRSVYCLAIALLLLVFWVFLGFPRASFAYNLFLQSQNSDGVDDGVDYTSPFFSTANGTTLPKEISQSISLAAFFQDSEYLHVHPDNLLAQYASVALKGEKIVINSDRITLGDLFTNTGDKAYVDVGIAPQPGQQKRFNVSLLYQLASANGLAWQPLSPSTYLVVTRRSSVVSHDDVADVIADYVLAATFTGALTSLPAINAETVSVDVDVDNFRDIYLPYNSVKPSLDITSLKFIRGGKKFNAEISLRDGNGSTLPIDVDGKIMRRILIPVPARQIDAGTVITSQDMAMLEVEERFASNNIVIALSDLVGKQALQRLNSGKPIAPRQIGKPILVRRNDLVTVVVQNPGFEITMRGKALRDGRIGDVVPILNTKSNRSIDAMVIDNGLLRIVVGQ